MILVALLLLLLLGGAGAWAAERAGPDWPGRVALAVLAAAAALVLALWIGADAAALPGRGGWIAEARAPWIAPLGISFHLAMDGLSLVMVALTVGLGIAAVLASRIDIHRRTGFFHFTVLWTLAGAVGVFLAMDLFLFFVFWEAMLVPMYFVIAVWGHERRVPAAIKFVVYTQGSGLLLLAATLALAAAHHDRTGIASFAYADLLATDLSPAAGLWIMLGFFAAFAVKLPVVPLHTWLPDAHTEAPTGGSVILAGILLKTGGYGLVRFVWPLFPDAAAAFAPVAMALGVAGILYGAVLAFAQTDVKRLVAYTSVAHLGFVLLGVFAGTAKALQGAVFQMVAHGLSTGALFIVAGLLQARLGTRDMGRMGGLWPAMPRLGALTLFFAVAALGLPGLGNFVGEFLVLWGTLERSIPFAAVAAMGLVTAVLYALALVQRTFHGEAPHGDAPAGPPPRDAGPGATVALAVMALAVAWLGLFRQTGLDAAAPALEALLQAADGTVTAAAGGPGR